MSLFIVPKAPPPPAKGLSVEQAEKMLSKLECVCGQRNQKASVINCGITLELWIEIKCNHCGKLIKEDLTDKFGHEGLIAFKKRINKQKHVPSNPMFKHLAI